MASLSVLLKERLKKGKRMIENLTLLIHSCGAYSDLWSGQVEMLNRYWGDRNIRTVILTDTNPMNYAFDGIEIFCAGEGKEITDRLKAFLPRISTEFVFVTLDDYYLLKNVDNERIRVLLTFMEEHHCDYMRLYNVPRHGKLIRDGIYEAIVKGKKNSYYINLYQGIWRKSFMSNSVVGKTLNAWQYEVSLTPFALKYGVKCAMTKGEEYRILDVIRKGKVLHKAHRYFKKDPVYTGNRPLLPRSVEFKLWFRSVLKSIFPRWLFQKVKRKMMKHGAIFYSPLDEDVYQNMSNDNEKIYKDERK